MKELKNHMYNAKVKEYMTKDITFIDWEDRLADIIFRTCVLGSDIAIVKSKGEIVGLITASDIYNALVKEAYVLQSIESGKSIDDIKMEDIMKGPPTKKFMTSCQMTGHRPCVQTDEDTSIGDAIRIMDKCGLHHLLVTDKNNELVGTISSNDIIKSFCIGRSRKE